MTFKKSLLNLLALIGLTTFQACGQQSKSATYKGDKFTLEYPAQWQTANENGTINFFPVENYGALTLSIHSGIDFSLDKTKMFILDMNEIKDKPSNVKMAIKGKVTEFYYEHIDKNVKWVTKAFRQNTDFYLLTINCDLNKWETNKDIFMKTINSFKLN
jgi:hypothetical protein